MEGDIGYPESKQADEYSIQFADCDRPFSINET